MEGRGGFVVVADKTKTRLAKPRPPNEKSRNVATHAARSSVIWASRPLDLYKVAHHLRL